MKRFVSLLAIFTLLFSCSSVLSEAHYMGDWEYQNDGRHLGKCIWDDFVMYVECSELRGEYEGKLMLVCPVCGHYNGGSGEHLRSETLLYDYSFAPLGDVLVMKYDAPFGENSKIAMAFTVTFEHAGTVSDFDGVYNVKFACEMPSSYRLLKAEGSELTEIPCSVDAREGTVSFTVSGGHGLYLVETN